MKIFERISVKTEFLHFTYILWAGKGGGSSDKNTINNIFNFISSMLFNSTLIHDWNLFCSETRTLRVGWGAGVLVA